MEERRMLYMGLMLVLIIDSFAACALTEETPSVVSSNVVQQECDEDPYRHKSIEQLSTMSPNQLIDESVKEQLYHRGGSWNLENHDDDYVFLFDNHLKKLDVEAILPVLKGYLDKYLPQDASKCEEIRFYVASSTISDLDNARVRLRAIPEGHRAIQALEKGVQRLRNAGFDRINHPRKYLYELSAHNLEMAKGTNIRDEMIRATLEARHKIRMSESEYLEFSNFLTSVDPKYPTWSEVGEYGPPTLVKDSKKYYEAYLKFKRIK